MTTDQASGDPRAEAREDEAFEKVRALFTALGPLHKKTRDNRYTIHPHSALALDRQRIPDLPVEYSVNRALSHSFDCLWGLHELLKQAGQQHFAPYVLLRGAIESAATAVWLLAPEERATRLERRAAIEADDASESRKAIRSAGITDPEDSAGQRIRALRPIVEAGGLSYDRCVWRGYTAVVRDVDDRPGEQLSLETAWRACSGLSHGKFWAFTTVAVESNRVPIGPNEFTADYTPSFHPLSIMLGAAVRTLQRADSLYDRRRAAILAGI